MPVRKLVHFKGSRIVPLPPEKPKKPDFILPPKKKARPPVRPAVLQVAKESGKARKPKVMPETVPVGAVEVMETPSRVDLQRLTDSNFAYQMRLEGFSFPEIAAKMAVSPTYAYKLFNEALERGLTATRETAEQMRDLEAARLDHMTKRLTPIVNSEIPDWAMDGISTSLKVSKARRDLLGLDAAQKMDVRVDTPGMRVYEGFNPKDV